MKKRKSMPKRQPAGRRPGLASSRAGILKSAGIAFGKNGFDGTSVRGIAAEAGVDPSTVLHFFGSKDGLFTAVIAELTPALEPLIGALGRRARGEELVRIYLSAWEGEHGPAMRALIRTAIASEQAVHLLGRYVEASVLAATAAEDTLEAELVLAQLMGISLGRFILRMPKLSKADIGSVASRMGPVLDGFLRRGR